MKHYAQTDTRRVGLGLNNGGWCPECRGEVYFMAKWRGVAGNYASECKQCGERRLFEDTDLIGAINALIAHGGRVTRRGQLRTSEGDVAQGRHRRRQANKPKGRNQ